MSITHLGMLILTMWITKVVMEICGLPISIKLAKILKKVEQLDIYDTDTKFNLFSFSSNYTIEQNRYQK
jgi:hypothetical protein